MRNVNMKNPLKIKLDPLNKRRSADVKKCFKNAKILS